jgi:hypothetical protein
MCLTHSASGGHVSSKWSPRIRRELRRCLPATYSTLVAIATLLITSREQGLKWRDENPTLRKQVWKLSEV